MSEKEQTAEDGKLWNASFIYLLILSALTSSSFQMVTPVLAKYVVSLGGSLALGGVVVGIFAITALTVRPFSGALADRFNKKRIMVVSTATIALMVLCYSFSRSIPLLIFFRIIHGAAFAASSTANTALASSFIPPHRMGEGFGFFGLGHILATAVGPSIGMTVLEHFGYSGLFFASFAISGLSAVLMNFIRHKHEKQALSKKIQIRFSDFIDMKLIPLAIFGGLLTFSSGIISSFISVLGDERSIANITVYFLVNSVALLVIRPLSGRLNDKMGITVVMIPAYILAFMAMLTLAGSYTIWMVALTAVFLAIGTGAGVPALQAECIRRLPDKRGVATGTYYIGLDVGFGSGPIIGGAVLSAFGFGTMYIAAGILLLAGLIAFILYRRHEQH